ncbi:MAG: MBL fold metallo-hydrolase [Acidimicrobiia bacterium]
MDVGDVRIDYVLDGSVHHEPIGFAGGTEEDWALHRDLLDEDGMIATLYGGFLIRSGDRNIVVDLGVGMHTLLGTSGGAFVDSLAALGLQPDDVTDVVFSHLHLDHIGWATDDERRPTFPSATYRCSAADWQHFMVDQRGIDPFGAGYTTDEVVDGAAEQFETWDHDGPLLPGIDVRAAPGHTPGSSVFVVSSGVERAMLIGDVVHCPIQLVDDEWGVMYDVDPDLARRTRLALNRELEDSETPVAAAHFPGARFGRLFRGEGRRHWVMS